MCLRIFFRKLFRSKEQNHNEESFNYDNLLNSMFNSEDLYKSFAKKCHPDLYPEELKEEADILFKELQKRKHDINGMKELQQLIENLYTRRG